MSVTDGKTGSRKRKETRSETIPKEPAHAFETGADFVALGAEVDEAPSSKKKQKKKQDADNGEYVAPAGSGNSGAPPVVPSAATLEALNGDVVLASLVPPGLSAQAIGRLHKLARQKVHREKMKAEQRERKEVRLAKDRERSSAKKAHRLEKAKAALAVEAGVTTMSSDASTNDAQLPIGGAPKIAGQSSGAGWFVDTTGATANPTPPFLQGPNGIVIDDESAKQALKAERKQRKKERKAQRALLMQLPKAERKKHKKEARAAKRAATTAARAERARSKKQGDTSQTSPKELGSASATTSIVDQPAQPERPDFHAPTSSSKPPRDQPAVVATDEAAVTGFLAENRISYEPAEAGQASPPCLSFDSLDVATAVKEGLAQYAKPTSIQSAVWPILLSGRDVVGVAETGSGKTLGFGVPALQHIHTLLDRAEKAVVCLIICPTRELAMQTHENLAAVVSRLRPSIRSACLYGGVDKKAQVKDLQHKGANIVVGTPGRLLDLARDSVLDLGGVSYLVLDEADRMLDKGFENDIRSIVGLCRPSPTSAKPFRFGATTGTRLTAMFSATWPTSVRRLAEDFMHDPVRVMVGTDELAASTSIDQSVIVLEDGRQKESKLLEVLKETGYFNQANKAKAAASRDKCLVFALYKKEAQRLHRFFKAKGFEVGCIEGDMTQDKRTEALDDFRAGRTALLVATDVAARGLDIPKVELVVNCTFPLTIEDYVHRIGRTGRAGRKGKAITFFTDQDKAHAGELARVLRDAGQPVPDDLLQFGTAIKKKQHSAFGAHFREIDPSAKPKKITF